MNNNDTQNQPKDDDKRKRLMVWLSSFRHLPLTIIALLLGISIAAAIILLPKNFGQSVATGNNGLSKKIKPLLSPIYPEPVQACLTNKDNLTEEDVARARIAWKYFENNFQQKTGLVNAADAYPSTTMWDTGTSIGATIAAYDLGLITEKDFDDRITAMLAGVYELKLYNNEAPNKVYNTATGEMVNYKNLASEVGIGVSVLDLARLSSWLNILACTHPKHANIARDVITHWNYCSLINDGQMYGLYLDPVTNKNQILQEGRLGYEQYAGKVFKMLGFDQKVSGTYNNEYKATININDVPIAYDNRDPRKFGAYNYVVTESYVMDVFEHGYDEENKPLTDNIYEVQKRQWQKTGQVTAVTEDNVDRKPNFVYNTIFASGSPWNAITDTGKDMEHLKTVSTKAAFSLAYLYPEDPYSKELLNAISSAYDPERGWYAGIYEKGLGYNDIITSNTNGVILTTMLYKKYGALNKLCTRCGKGLSLKPDASTAAEFKEKCISGRPTPRVQ
ncbi:MAG: DUF3131 domain-containing protein [Methylococcaceae bacterium]|nr:DUF3131 domain-containing protein [Methylococcaceae bacterium]